MSTYEMKALYKMNVGVSRSGVDIGINSSEIEFNRYLSDTQEHQDAFVNCLWTFQQHLPLTKTPELIEKWDYFYERSIGCIGILKDWLTQALALALENGGKMLTWRDLQSQAPSVTRSAKMLEEALRVRAD